MKNADYWQKRFAAIEQMNHKKAAEAIQATTPAFDRAQTEIQKEIESWYQRFADNNGVSLTEAKKMLSAKELKELKWDVNEYIKYGRENAIDPKWAKELENASAKFHISRLEALKIRTQQAAEKAFGNETDILDNLLADTYTEDYYHSAFEIQKGIGIGFDIGTIDNDKLDKLLKKPWTADKKTFSDRIWGSKTQLLDVVNKELTQMCILGKAPNDAIEAISKAMGVSKKQAGRLVMTESAYFSSEAQKDCFNNLEVEMYEIVATLDSETSEICREMDGQHFPMKDYQAGVTAPPFHPWCRSCTVPYFDDEFATDGKRAAKGEDGKTYLVPADMKYEDWKKSFVDGGDKDNLTSTIPTTQNGISYGNSLDGYTDNEKNRIKDLLQNAPTEIKEVYNKYSNELLEHSETIDPKKGTAYYDPADKRVHLKSLNAATGNEYQEPYQIHFHEYAHNIDYLAGNGTSFVAKYKNSAGKTLEDVIMSDCENSVRQFFEDTITDINGAYQEAFTLQLGKGGMGAESYVRSLISNWRTMNGLSRKDPVYLAVKNEIDFMIHTDSALRDFYTKNFDKFGKRVYNSTKTFEKFTEYIKDNYTKKELGNLSDMFGRYSVQKGQSSYTLGFGHEDWYITSIGGLSQEAFAEMTDATITSSGSLGLIKKYLPNAYSMYLEILKVI